MTIGTKIKNLRIALKLTQEELASAVGTKKQTIHKYETGIISNIPASKIKALADKLETTPAYLMGWEEEEKNEKLSIYDKYNSLNYIGKKKADSYIDDLCEQEKYTKNTVSENINTTYNTPPRELAAFGAKGTKGTYKKPTREIT